MAIGYRASSAKFCSSTISPYPLLPYVLPLRSPKRQSEQVGHCLVHSIVASGYTFCRPYRLIYNWYNSPKKYKVLFVDIKGREGVSVINIMPYTVPPLVLSNYSPVSMHIIIASNSSIKTGPLK